ncbi:MAG: outer membrane beta-barrel protein [bacterium]|nr:outer membrane beta-barrel protein [Candidatus Kapabacteria bacterium]
MKYLCILLVVLCCASRAGAQSLGFGAGLALPNDEIAQLPDEVLKDGWRAIESRAEQGYHIGVRARIGGKFGIIGGISFNRFLDAKSEYRDDDGRTITLISSQSVVPLSAGFEYRFEDGFFSPYASLEGTMSYFYRGFESPHHSIGSPFSIESTGEARFGAALGAGISLDLTLLRFDVGTKLQFVNLFGDASTTEATMYFGQLGATAYFGL